MATVRSSQEDMFRDNQLNTFLDSQFEHVFEVAEPIFENDFYTVTAEGMDPFEVDKTGDIQDVMFRECGGHRGRCCKEGGILYLTWIDSNGIEIKLKAKK